MQREIYLTWSVSSLNPSNPYKTVDVILSLVLNLITEQVRTKYYLYEKIINLLHHLDVHCMFFCYGPIVRIACMCMDGVVDLFHQFHYGF